MLSSRMRLISSVGLLFPGPGWAKATRANRTQQKRVTGGLRKHGDKCPQRRERVFSQLRCLISLRVLSSSQRTAGWRGFLDAPPSGPFATCVSSVAATSHLRLLSPGGRTLSLCLALTDDE